MPVRSEAEELVFNLLQAILPERLPEQMQLLPNYPNPFNPETWIPFEVNQDSEVLVTIYNVAGTPEASAVVICRQEGMSANHVLSTGTATDTGDRVASGTYFYALKAADYVSTWKMIILK